MLLHEGLTRTQSLKKPWLHFGESSALRFQAAEAQDHQITPFKDKFVFWFGDSLRVTPCPASFEYFFIFLNNIAWFESLKTPLLKPLLEITCTCFYCSALFALESDCPIRKICSDWYIFCIFLNYELYDNTVNLYAADLGCVLWDYREINVLFFFCWIKIVWDWCVMSCT